MLVEIKVPQLSDSVTEATLLNWHKKVGEFVKRDENLIDIETDKVVFELPAQASGVLKRVVKADGATVASDEVIGMIDTDAKPSKVTAQAAISMPPQSAASLGAAVSLPSPAARKLMEEQGLVPEKIAASGKGGRITKEDVLNHLQQAEPSAPLSTPALTPASALGGERPEQRVPMTRLRMRIAERLVEAQRTAAILTTFNEANMQPIMELRARYRESFEKAHHTKLGFMSFFVKAVVAALKGFPVVNASVDGQDVIYHGYYDIGIAVSSPRGLVVPILRNADQLSFAQIELGISELGAKAKDSKLTLEELTGGTFSISNGGIFGSLMSTPILNPPQSAILGMHKIMERPIAENGQVVIRPMMNLALSYDHRIVDGREAVLFLVAIKEALEDPARLLLEI